VTYLQKLVVVSGCLLGWSGAGCSPSNSGGADATSLPVAEFPTQLADTICDMVAPCCQSAGVPHDSASCKSAATAYFQSYIDKSSGPGVVYDAAAAGRCLGAVRSALQSCTNFDDDTTGVACAYIFVGSVPLGGACQKDSECADHGGCGVDPNVPDGTGQVCVALPSEQKHAKAGDACSGSCAQLNDGSVECEGRAPTAGGSTGGGSAAGSCFSADGLFCNSTTQVCTALAPIGQPCEDAGCVAGAFCSLGKCQAQLDSGPCTGGSDACSDKSYCDDNSQLCTPKLADGAPCELSNECSSDKCSETSDPDPSKRTCGAPTAATPALCAGQFG
jgi:hypothetical protein